MALSLPELEGKYEILQKIGGGGMGAVYKVRHLLLDEVRVVKVVKPQVEERASLRQRFLHEARAATRLRHPNVAAILDFSVAADGTGYMVLEYIEGLTLLEILRQQGPPPLGLALEIGLQSLRAIEYLHRKGFVHRDISPDNLMLTVDVDERPLVKLIDLGIAKALDGGPDLTRTRQFLGKLRYASPESIRHGAAGVDFRSDLYSFGVVLYQLLTGTYPIPGSDPESLMSGHLYERVTGFELSDPERRIPEPLQAAVLRTLEKDPGRRFGSAGELAARLRQVQKTTAAADTQIDTVSRLLLSGVTPLPSTPSPGTTQQGLDELFPPEPTSAGEQPPEPTAVAAAEPTALDLQSLVECKRRVHRARSRLASGERAAARELLIGALELDPTSAEARRLLAEIEPVEEGAAESEQAGEELERLFRTAGSLLADADLEIARQEEAGGSGREPGSQSLPVVDPSIDRPTEPGPPLRTSRLALAAWLASGWGLLLVAVLVLAAFALVIWLV